MAGGDYSSIFVCYTVNVAVILIGLVDNVLEAK